MSSAMPACSSSSRWGSGVRRARLMTPHSISRPIPGAPLPVSITPYPVTEVPGSTPSTLTSRRHRRHRLGVDVEIRRNLRDVVHLFQGFDQLEQLLRIPAVHLDGALGDHRDLRGLHRNPPRLELLL